jgi:hypothetical protein
VNDGEVKSSPDFLSDKRSDGHENKTLVRCLSVRGGKLRAIVSYNDMRLAVGVAEGLTVLLDSASGSTKADMSLIELDRAALEAVGIVSPPITAEPSIVNSDYYFSPPARFEVQHTFYLRAFPEI